MSTDHSKRDQCTKILAFLQEGNRINPLQALRSFSCNRLAARIYDLKKDGHQIRSRRLPVVNVAGQIVSVSEYFIEPAEEAA